MKIFIRRIYKNEDIFLYESKNSIMGNVLIFLYHSVSCLFIFFSCLLLSLTFWGTFCKVKKKNFIFLDISSTLPFCSYSEFL